MSPVIERVPPLTHAPHHLPCMPVPGEVLHGVWVEAWRTERLHRRRELRESWRDGRVVKLLPIFTFMVGICERIRGLLNYETAQLGMKRVFLQMIKLFDTLSVHPFLKLYIHRLRLMR